uniref:Uncharacterized protein n=1 Tax=uncultured bacterium contig00006 TaxID=1181498 RepID=A0A806KBS1_9BACT|nr:hypothetical protein [uncultured bacterium contig00006]
MDWTDKALEAAQESRELASRLPYKASRNTAVRTIYIAIANILWVSGDVEAAYNALSELARIEG